VGTLKWQSGDRIYVDTNLFIYAVEQVMPFAPQVKPLLQAADQGTVALITSLLTLAETLVMPCRQENDRLVSVYRELFTLPPPGLTVVPLDAAILERAARLRALAPNLYLPDAIHLATAQSERCDLFVTNDSRLKAAPGTTVILLQD
jgi:predicted nucleic acid-binding protein